MKKLFKTTLLPLITLICGLIGFGLRLWLFGTGIDEKGLLVTGHPAGILVWILTAVVIAAVALGTRKLAPISKYSQLFPASIFACIGCVLGAAGILYVNIREYLLVRDVITLVTMILGLLAGVALVLLGVCRCKGKRPAFWLQSIVTVYFMLHLVSQYRLWSAEPQLQVYFFPLLASVFLMLTAYHGAVLDAEKGSRRWYVFSSQCALFFCCLSLQGTSWPFYLTMALWLATGLCSLKAAEPQAKETEEG